MFSWCLALASFDISSFEFVLPRDSRSSLVFQSHSTQKISYFSVFSSPVKPLVVSGGQELQQEEINQLVTLGSKVFDDNDCEDDG